MNLTDETMIVDNESGRCRRGRPRRGEVREVPPCCRCGTPGGAANADGRPFRTSGVPYGLAGMLCNRCRCRMASSRLGPEPDEPAEGSFDGRLAFARAVMAAGYDVVAALDERDAREAKAREPRVPLSHPNRLARVARSRPRLAPALMEAAR